MPRQPAVTQVEEHLRRWATEVRNAISPAGIFLFGSLVYKNGLQFDSSSSDIDLVVGIPLDRTTAPERAEWIENLAVHKHRLELDLLQLLRRPDANSPICSVVAPTETEIRSDIHKDGAKYFFSQNLFRNLLNQEPDGALPSAGIAVIDDHLVSSSLQFAQKVRNVFLATSANGARRLAEWKGSDPIPKEVMRHAAMAAAARSGQRDPGVSFDVKIGLDYLTEHLYERRERSKHYYLLHDWVSGRRGARGTEEAASHLKPAMYLLLAEVVYDLGAEALVNVVGPNGKTGRETGSVDTSIKERAADRSDTLPRTEALPATFAISPKFSLSGSVDEVKATIEEATHNLKWKLEPAFRIAFDEDASLTAAISKSLTDMKPSERRQLARSRDRKLRLEYIAPSVERGVRLILYYQNLLFPDSPKREMDLIIALNSFLRRVERTAVESDQPRPLSFGLCLRG